jgi:hypothetical protein
VGSVTAVRRERQDGDGTVGGLARSPEIFAVKKRRKKKTRRVPETRTWFFAASPTSRSVSVKAT